jgi:hypothetical protein
VTCQCSYQLRCILSEYVPTDLSVRTCPFGKKYSFFISALIHSNKGFETQQVAVAEVRLPTTTYNTDASRTAFDDAVLANLRAIPGVETAGLGSAMPLEGETWIEGIQRLDGRKGEALINLRWASPGYFETLKEHLLAGRFLDTYRRSIR